MADIVIPVEETTEYKDLLGKFNSQTTEYKDLLGKFNSQTTEYKDLLDKFNSLSSENEKLKADLKKAHADLNDAFLANNALTAELEKSSDAKAPVQTANPQINPADHNFTLDDVKYGFRYAKMIFEKQIITPLEVKASEAIQRKLVEIGSTMIKKIS